MISTIKIQHVIAVAVLVFAATSSAVHAQAMGTLADEETVTAPALGAVVEVEMQRRFVELQRQHLDDRLESIDRWAETVTWWLAGAAVLFTALGIILTLSFRYKAREAIKKAQASSDRANEAADKAEKAKDKAVKDSEEIEEKGHKIEEMMSTFPENVGNYEGGPTNVRQLENATKESMEKQILHLSEFIHREPKRDFYTIRGFLKAKLGRHQDAIEDYYEAIRLAPKRSRSYHLRGISKAALGRYHAAIEDYDEAIRLDMKHINAHMYRGFAKAWLDRIGGAEGALSDLQTALNLAKESGDDARVAEISNAIREIEQW